MNEKYATLSLVQLKELAKSQGVKNVSTMRKAQLVQLMGELEEKYNKEKSENREEKSHREKGENREERNHRERYSREKTEVREEKRPEVPTEQSGEEADMRMDSSLEMLDSGQMAHGILEVLSDGYGFIRCENYLPGSNDVSPKQILQDDG